jgi:hypothetical protein
MPQFDRCGGSLDLIGHQFHTTLAYADFDWNAAQTFTDNRIKRKNQALRPGAAVESP